MNIRDLFGKLEGVEDIMEDPHTTSVRLVTNPGWLLAAQVPCDFCNMEPVGLASICAPCSSGLDIATWRAPCAI